MTASLPRINQTQIKAWRHCQKKWDFQFGQRLVKRRKDRPLYLGSWGHAALESYYRDGAWQVGHKVYKAEYDKLWDEEREYLDRNPQTGKPGEPLPSQVERIMASYLWYYRYDPKHWTFSNVEMPFEVTILDAEEPFVLKGRVDLVGTDEEGNKWVWDHKWPGDIPDEDAFHSMDPQLVLYPWALEQQYGIETVGVIYNYVRAKAPSVPTLNKDGTISKRAIVTDHPTVYRFLIENGRDPNDYAETLDPLAGSSPLLRRYRLPRSDAVTARVLEEARWTARDILRHTTTTRNVTRLCGSCGYMALCRAELFGLDTSLMRRRDYDVEKEEADGNDSGSEQASSEAEVEYL